MIASPGAKGPFNQRQRSLWEAVHSYIVEHRGLVTAQGYTSPIRFECKAGSELPEKLRRLGYDLKNAGNTDRLMPVIEEMREDGTMRTITRQHVAPTTVEIFEFKLPFG